MNNHQLEHSVFSQGVRGSVGGIMRLTANIIGDALFPAGLTISSNTTNLSGPMFDRVHATLEAFGSTFRERAQARYLTEH